MSFTAVILLAGLGSRLRPLTDESPKCLLPLDRAETILSRMVRQLIFHGARAIVASTGYRAHSVREALNHCPVPVYFAHNPDFESTQNVVSLHRALSVAPPDELIKLDGDLVFEDAVLARIIADRTDAQFALDSHGPLGDEEMKVTVSLGRALSFGKGLDPDISAGESIGIERFGPSTRAELERSVALAVEQGCKHIYYEEVYNDMVARGTALCAVEVGDLMWVEVDTAQDLSHAQKLLANGS